MVNTIDKNKTSKQFYLAQLLFLLYFCLVIYASLTPFNFFLTSHVQIWSWLEAPVPRFIPIFDVLSNIIGYLPFGFLMIFSLYPKLLKWQALIVTLLLGAGFSAGLESLQTYLPTRIPSLIDVYSNIFGVLLGALFALPLSPQWLSGNKAEKLRSEIFGQQQGYFLLLLLCPLAQIYPQNAWLGMGDLGFLWTRVSPYWGLPLSNVSQEALLTTMATFSVGTIFLLGIKKTGIALKFIAGLLILMVVLKLFVSQFQFRQSGMASWWSISVFIGLISGYFLTCLAFFLRRETLWTLAIVSLISLITLVNLLPYNPYFVHLLEQLPQGKMRHINGVFEWISVIWPFVALCVLFSSRKSQP